MYSMPDLKQAQSQKEETKDNHIIPDRKARPWMGFRLGFFFSTTYSNNYAAFGRVDISLDSIRRSGFQFPLLVRCRRVGQIYHSMLPLPT